MTMAMMYKLRLTNFGAYCLIVNAFSSYISYHQGQHYSAEFKCSVYVGKHLNYFPKNNAPLPHWQRCSGDKQYHT